MAVRIYSPLCVDGKPDLCRLEKMKFPPFTLPFIFSSYESAAAQDFLKQEKRAGLWLSGATTENATGRKHYFGAVCEQ
jgi:hypothetical protein